MNLIIWFWQISKLVLYATIWSLAGLTHYITGIPYKYIQKLHQNVKKKRGILILSGASKALTLVWYWPYQMIIEIILTILWALSYSSRMVCKFAIKQINRIG